MKNGSTDELEVEHINKQSGLTFSPQGSSAAAGTLTTIIGLPATTSL
jgi:hypothetical protein